jgi:hypothetical protein
MVFARMIRSNAIAPTGGLEIHAFTLVLAHHHAADTVNVPVHPTSSVRSLRYNCIDSTSLIHIFCSGVCNAPFYGTACERVAIVCPNACSGRGRCDESTQKCACSSGFTGPDCSHVEVPSVCQRCLHGDCMKNSTRTWCEVRSQYQVHKIVALLHCCIVDRAAIAVPRWMDWSPM